MKRVAIFSVTYHPFIGGAEVAIKEFTARLPEYVFDLYAAKLDDSLPDVEHMGNVTVYRVGTGRRLFDKWLYPWGAARLALMHHHQNPYDLIHAVLETYAGVAALLFKKREPKVPYLLTMQSGDSDWFIRLRTWFWYPWYRQVFTRADKITAISFWLKDRAKGYGTKEEDIEIIPNAVDERFLEIGSPQERARVRSSWGVRDQDIVVITASRLVRKNGVDTLIDAMERVPENAKLVIAGTGADERSLKSRAKRFGNRVLFLGHIGHDILPALLRSADIFVRASRSEGLGNAFIEARAAGLAVIGTPVGGINDLIKAGIVEPAEGNAAAIAEKIASAVRSAGGAASPERGRGRIREQYSWDVVARQYGDEYKKLLTAEHVSSN